jgi:hypothetical protein
VIQANNVKFPDKYLKGDIGHGRTLALAKPGWTMALAAAAGGSAFWAPFKLR